MEIPPPWQHEAEQIGIELRGLILGEIEAKFGGNVPLYVRQQFGVHALKSIIEIADDNAQREGAANIRAFRAEMLLRYAANRSAFRVLTAKAGYRDLDSFHPTPAAGNEAIAVVTQSGSMVFGSSGCLTRPRAYCYLPIAGRDVKPFYTWGQISPARWLPRSLEEEPRLKAYEGLMLLPGQMVSMPRKDRGRRWRTSPVVEVKVRRGNPDDPEDWWETQAAIHSLSTLNLGFGGDAQPHTAE